MRVKFNEEQKQMRKKISKTNCVCGGGGDGDGAVCMAKTQNHKSKRTKWRKKKDIL